MQLFPSIGKLGFLLISFFLLFIGVTDAQETLTLQNFNAIPSNSKVFNILEKANDIYISTNKGLYKLNTSSNEVSELFAGKSIQHVCFIKGKSYIVAHRNKVLDKRGKTLFQFDSNVHIYKIIPYENKIWISTNNGIYVMRADVSKINHHYTLSNSKLIDNNVKIMLKDRKGTMWIGMDKGLITVDDSKWDVEYKKIVTHSITENKEGVWIHNDKDLQLINFDGRLADIGLQEGLQRGKVTNISINSKGKIYIASNILVGLDPYDDEINSLGNEIELLSKQVTSSLFDKKDKLWIGTEQSGLFLLTIEKVNQAKVNKEEEVIVTETPVLSTILLVKNDIKCSDSKTGSLEVQVKGGISPYRFNWSTGSSSKIIEGLGAGEYSVTVTDTEANSTISIFNFVAPLPISISVQKQKFVSKKGRSDGSVILDIDGGRPEYSIFWDDIKGKTSNNKLGIGDHIVIVTDVNGCKGETGFEMTVPKILSALSMSRLEVGQTLPIKQLYFDADSTVVKEASFEVLEEIFEFLVLNSTVKIEIGGHTNNIPTHNYCNKLSSSRAEHVADFLVEKGLDNNRIQFKGYGKTSPIASNKTPSGRKKNQRVELKILEL